MDKRVLLTALIWITTLSWASPRIYLSGVTIYAPARACNSFVAFSAPDGNTHLIDMHGHEVHRWPRVGLPGNVSRARCRQRIA